MDMRVAGIHNAYSVYNSQNASNGKKADQLGKADSAKDLYSLSDKAEDYQAIRNALAEAPDIRKGKVDSIKAKIDAGIYNVTAVEIADKILQGMVQ